MTDTAEEDVEETEETVIVEQEATGDAVQQPDSNSHEGSNVVKNILLGLALCRRFYYPLLVGITTIPLESI